MTISNSKRESATTPHRIVFANVKDNEQYDFAAFNQLVQALANVPVGCVGSYEVPPFVESKGTVQNP